MDKKERLIDYLYGEMTAAESREFEALLSQDEDLRAELNALQQTRHRLAQLPDIQPETTVVTVSPPRPPWHKWGWRMGAAAVVLLLLSFLNPHLEIGSNGIVFALGNPAPVATKAEQDAEVLLANLEAQLVRRDLELEQRLLQMDSLWQNRLVSREERLQQNWDRQLTAYQAKRQKDLEQFAQYLVSEEVPELVTLVQHLQLEQQDELRSLLSDFWNQWQDTRVSDLQSIETEFVNLYRNVEFNQSETEAILKSLVVSR